MTQMEKVTAKYFKESEFVCCTPSCSLQDMKQSTMDKLDKARELAGIPFVLNSAYRSKEYEISKGRAGTSSHTLGYAVDIRCNTSENRFKIVTALREVGFNRIGIAKTYIHVDNSPHHKPNVIWDYYNS